MAEVDIDHIKYYVTNKKYSSVEAEYISWKYLLKLQENIMNKDPIDILDDLIIYYSMLSRKDKYKKVCLKYIDALEDIKNYIEKGDK